MRLQRSSAKIYLPTWILYAWFLFFILNPFLVLGSGLPQPADWVMAVIFLYIFLQGLKPFSPASINLIDKHRMFVIYVTLVNSIWFFFIDQSQEKRFPTFVHSFFYIFNFLTLRSILILSVSFRNRFLTYTTYAIGLGMILQAFLAVALGSTGSRNALFFNNPNQLGYYALLSGSLFIYCIKYVKLPTYYQLATLFSFFFLTLLSSSKAALAGSVILIALTVLNQGLVNVRQFAIIVLAIGIGYYFISQAELGSNLFNYSLKRFELIGKSKDDSYEGRGYDRILNDPEYLVLGAGEGGYHRFDTLLDAGEIHSSFGTILFCYGVLGLFLFFRFLFAIFQRSSWLELLYFVPVFAYSITHQGLRDTLFWVFLGVIYVTNESKILIRPRRFIKRQRLSNITSSRAPLLPTS